MVATLASMLIVKGPQWGCNGDCEIEKLDTGLVIVVEISEANDE